MTITDGGSPRVQFVHERGSVLEGATATALIESYVDLDGAETAAERAIAVGATLQVTAPSPAGAEQERTLPVGSGPLEVPLQTIADGTGNRTSVLEIVGTTTVGVAVGARDTYTLTILDATAAQIGVNPGAVTVRENGEATFEVFLTVTPANPVTVDVAVQAGPGGEEVAASPATLTFTAAGAPRTVTVTAGDDEDASGGSATVVLSSDDGEYAGSQTEVAVTVADDDAPFILVQPTEIVLREGESTTYDVTAIRESETRFELFIRVALMPTAAGTDPGGLEVDTQMVDGHRVITFEDVGDVKRVTVTAVDDADAVDDEWRIVHSVRVLEDQGHVTYRRDVVLPVTVVDDERDQVRLLVEPEGPLALVEGGESEAFRVSLGTAPREDVTVQTELVVGDSEVPVDDLTFTPANWGIVQTVTVEPPGEDADTAGQTGTLTFRTDAEQGEYSGMTVAVEMTFEDETVRGILLLGSADADPEGGQIGLLSVPESDAADGGEPAQEDRVRYWVRLMSPPEDAATVTITLDEPESVLRVDPPALTFTGDTWETPQAVTLWAVADEDSLFNRETLTHTASGYEGADTVTLEVTVIDDEAPPPRASFVSTPKHEPSYGPGERIVVRLTFPPGTERPVPAAAGAALALRLGPEGSEDPVVRQAWAYTPPAVETTDDGETMWTLDFQYDVGVMDVDGDGVDVGEFDPDHPVTVGGQAVPAPLSPPRDARSAHRVGIPVWKSTLEGSEFGADVSEGNSVQFRLEILNKVVFASEDHPDGEPWEVALEAISGSAGKDEVRIDGDRGLKHVPPGAFEIAWTVEALDDGEAEDEESLELVAVAWRRDPRNPHRSSQAGEFHTLTILAEGDETPSAVVYGDVVEIRYPRPLDTATRPSTADFVVEVDGVPRPLTGVGIAGARVLLALASPVAPGDVVEASYPAPGVEAVRYRAGRPAGPFYRLVADVLDAPPAAGAGTPQGAPAVASAAPGEVTGARRPGRVRTRATPEDAGTALAPAETGASAPVAEAPGLSGRAGAAAAGIGEAARVAARLLEQAPPELGPPATVAAGTAGIWDAALAAAVAEALAARPGTGVEALVALRAAGRGIAELGGLERAAGLREVDLADNALTDLGPLTALAGLRRARLARNRVADLGPLAALAELRRLDLSGNRVKDLAPLIGLARLETLLLAGNAVTDVGPLARLPALVRLDLTGNPVADLAPLAELLRLRRLDAAFAAIADVSPLGDAGSLVWIDLAGNPVVDTSPLWRLTALRWLWAEPAAFGWLAEPGRTPRLLVHPAPPNRAPLPRVAPSPRLRAPGDAAAPAPRAARD